MKTERDLRLLVLPLTLLPVLFYKSSTPGTVHLPEGSLVPLVYAALATVFYLGLCRWLFPMREDKGRQAILVPFLGGFVLAPLLVLSPLQS